MNTSSKRLMGVLIISIVSSFMVFKSSVQVQASATPIQAYFPQTVDELRARASEALKRSKQQLQELLSVPRKKRTFANTFGALDILTGELAITGSVIHLIQQAHPVEEMRNAAQEEELKITAWSIEALQDQTLYQLLKETSTQLDQKKLAEEYRYYIKETLLNFKRNGLELAPEKLAQVKKLSQEIEELTSAYQKRLSEDMSSITRTADQLAGIPQSVIDGLIKNPEGTYVVGVDYPTVSAVMENCSVTETRKALWLAFVNRAYPRNEETLRKLIELRTQYAQLLGYRSYAAFDCEDTMAGSVERVRKFLDDLTERSRDKVKAELKTLLDADPTLVERTADGKLDPWDVAYLKNSYKKKFLDIDEQALADYFPLDQTIDRLLSIYASFFNIRFEKQLRQDLWYPNLTEVKVYIDAEYRGSIILDLFPREGKYKHAAIFPLIPALQHNPRTFLCAMMANFPPATDAKPALCKRTDAITFFHEFGHALHGICGRTLTYEFSGFHVKPDFVELPSQLLEEWMWDKDILRFVSGNYITGQPLSDNVLDKLVALHVFDAGLWLTRQLHLSYLALELYDGNIHGSIDQLAKIVHTRMLYYMNYDPQDHMVASFGHLTNGLYMSKYYGYLWSRVYAVDVFDQIKLVGLLNPVIGQRYRTTVLAPGGSVPPDRLLKEFLGREPRIDAFLQSMGLTKGAYART